MIVLDSSAIIALLRQEPLADAIAERIFATGEGGRLLSVANYLETSSVLIGREPARAKMVLAELDALLADFGVSLAPVDEAQARLAIEARVRLGRGMGNGCLLNFGDCFSYALAKANLAPLLFIGNDFVSTDIVSALAEPGGP